MKRGSHASLVEAALELQRVACADGQPSGTERFSVSVSADERYDFVDPVLALQVGRGDGMVTVSDTFSTVYGTGDDTSGAVADYVTSFFDYLAKLETRESLLAPGLQRELASLRQRTHRKR